MIKKLELQIDLSNKMDIDDDGILSEEYSVSITVLDKDERFNVENKTGQSLFHNGTGSFVIKTIWDEKMGGILHNGLLLPSNSRLGITHEKVFKDDMERYYFLKKLYVAIYEWANYWGGFEYDSNSHITVIDNIWTVECDDIYKGSTRYMIDDYGDSLTDTYLVT
jgi:hypothetical protein